MALQRPFLCALAAVLPAELAGCAAPSPAAAEAPQSAVDRVERRLDLLQEQQQALLEELRALRGELDPHAAGGDEPVRPPAPRLVDDAPSGDVPAVDALPVDAIAVDAPAGSTEMAEPAPAIPPAQHWVVVARRLMDEEDFATALRVLNVAAEVDPADAEVRFHRGVARHLLQRYADALEDFDSAIALTSRQDLRIICLYNEGCALARLGRVEEAIDRLVAADAAGFRDLLQQINIDPDLDSLRDEPRFRDFTMELRTR